MATTTEVPRLSVAQRIARGKAARKEVPRAAHAMFEPPSSRADPVELLERQAKTRVAELVPIRYGRMLVSPFTFYRGAAMIMAHDLETTPRSGLTVQCCGDAHLSNFGAFASPERRLVFDVNDFDETLPGPWEWDVKRLAASMLIAARDNGFREKDGERIVLDTAGAYRTAMASFALNCEPYSLSAFSVSRRAYHKSRFVIPAKLAIAVRYRPTVSSTIRSWSLARKPLSRAAINMLAANRLTSHSHGPGSVSSKSLTSNTSRRSGEANTPKFDRCASPQHCTVSPDRGVALRSLAMIIAAPR